MLTDGLQARASLSIRDGGERSHLFATSVSQPFDSSFSTLMVQIAGADS